MSSFAAVDVGSNSIRLLIAEVDALGRMTPIHEDREVVRLGTGVFRNGRLCGTSMSLACRVLARMAEAIERHQVASVRAVGTSALRDASNRSEFVLNASSILGAPLEVVGGLQEARLVQRGVAAQWPHEHERVLIVDVGGGSVQLILSDRERFAAGTSLPLGAVRLTEGFVSGVAVIDGIMSGLRLPRLQYSTAGVREGIIAELAHRGTGIREAGACAVLGFDRNQPNFN